MSFQRIYFANAFLGLLLATILLLVNFLVLDFSFDYDRFLIFHQVISVLPAGIFGGILYAFIQKTGHRLNSQRLIINGIGAFAYFIILLFAYVESLIAY